MILIYIIFILLLIVIICWLISMHFFYTRLFARRTARQEKHVLSDDNKSKKSCNIVSRCVPDWSRIRDNRVINDQLYPPENRSDALNYDIMYDQIQNRNFYVPTNNYGDTYRMVGYLSNKNRVNGEKDFGGDIWKVMARQIDNNRSQFYIIPSNNDYNLKIPITDDIIKSRHKLRDVYDIPNEIRFDTPLLSSNPYIFTELPRNNWINSVY